MKTPEGKPKAEIRKYLDSLGAYHFSPVSFGYGSPAIDILCCIRGHFLGVEVKRPDKPCVPTPRQDHVIRAIRKAGGIAFTTNSLWDFQEKLEEAWNDLENRIRGKA